MPFRMKIDTADVEVVSDQIRQLTTTAAASAQMKAANRIGFLVRSEWAKKTGEVFDRPTPFTQRAMLITKATQANPIATVRIRDEAEANTPAQYLSAQIEGGIRRHKRFERWLQARGLMPQGWYAVPGDGATLDAFGNLLGGLLNKILTQLGASPDALSNQTERSKQRDARKRKKAGARGGTFYAVPAGRPGLLPGIYERIGTGFGGGLRSIIIFVSSAAYEARFPVFQFATDEIKTEGPRVLSEEIAREIDKLQRRNV